MIKLWYYLKKGQFKGPVSSETIAEMVVQSELSKGTPVLDMDTRIWVDIGNVPELNSLVRAIQQDYYGSVQDNKQLAEMLYNHDDLFARLELLSRRPIFMNTPWQQIPLLMFLTGGLYQLYWMYRQWFRAETLEVKSGNLLKRTSFLIIFIPITIFTTVEGLKEFRRVSIAQFNPYFLALLWYASLALTILNPLGGDGLISVLFRFGFSLSGMLPIIITQRYINECNHLLGRDKPIKE